MDLNDNSDVLIIGGGVIGAACAYFLTRSGRSVTLIDKGDVGHGCSYGNCGWIVPSHGMPLPMPGVPLQAFKWIFRKDSPLYIQPRLSLAMARWLLRFCLSANGKHLNHAVPALVELATHSLQIYKELATGDDVPDFGFKQRGLIYCAASRSGLAAARHELEIITPLGVRGREVDETELRCLEPAVIGPIVGGVHFEDEATVEPLKAVQCLATLAERQGARILPRTEMFAVETAGGRIQSVRTTQGRLGAGQYVLAAGSWTPPLARQLRLNVPIEAGAGYAVITEPFEPGPRLPLMLVEKKVCVTARDSSFRFAGTLELAGLNQAINPVRVDAILAAARSFLAVPDDVRITETWRGLRPCTPDGLPIIGRPPPWENLVIAAGHAMLGLTLATATGRLVSDLITGSDPLVDPRPFRPERF